MAPIRPANEDVDEVLGATLARRFAGDARRLAHAARLILLTDDGLRPRTLLYEPPLLPSGTGAVVLPAGTPADVATAMLAVAVGLHLEGTPRATAYADGVLIGPTMPRHRAAVCFAQGFIRATRTGQARPTTEVATRDRAG